MLMGGRRDGMGDMPGSPGHSQTDDLLLMSHTVRRGLTALNALTQVFDLHSDVSKFDSV